MIRINLIRGKRRKKAEFNLQSLYILIPVVVLAGVFLVHRSVTKKIDTLNNDIRKATARIETLKKEIGEVEKFKARKAELQKKVDIISSLQTGRVGPAKILDTIGSLVPENSWVDKMSLAGDKVTVEGIAMNNVAVADFMNALTNSGKFRDVVLGSADQTTVSGTKLVKFSLTFFTAGI